MQDWVLFVPGFAASHLFKYDYGGDRGVKLWLSQVEIAWGGIADLDTADDVSPTDPERVRAGSPLMEVYQPFTSFLASHGIPVALFGFDWRADVATNGQRLANFINDERTSEARWSIVAHSAGGLIAASAINRIADSAIPRVQRLITCGTPWHGSYRAMQMFSGTHETVQTIVALNQVASRRNVLYWLSEALRVVASWPGLYDLLPMPEMHQHYPPGPGQDFVTDPVFTSVNPAFNIARYTEAVARRPIHVGFPPGVQHLNCRGMGRPTAGPSPTMHDGRPSFWPQALFGDSTVPEFSSVAPAAFNAIDLQFDADHEQFLSEHRVQQTIGRAMGFLD